MLLPCPHGSRRPQGPRQDRLRRFLRGATVGRDLSDHITKFGDTMHATPSEPFNRRVSWQVLFLRTLIAGSGACLASIAGAKDANTAAETAAAGGPAEDGRT